MERGFVSSFSWFPSPPHIQECPSGIVNEENFKQIYSQFFPQGGEGTSPKRRQLSVSKLSGGEGSGGARNAKRMGFEEPRGGREVGSPLLEAQLTLPRLSYRLQHICHFSLQCL